MTLAAWTSMPQQASARIGNLLTEEGLLTAEQLAKTISIQAEQDPPAPVGELCVSLGYVTSTELEQVLVKHRRRIPLGELLVHLGLITPAQIQNALERQKKQKPRKKIGAVLVESGYIDEVTLIRT